MNKLFQKLLQQAGSRVLPQAARSVQGFADELVTPVLRGVGTQAENALVRSVGAVQDAVVRPISRFSQESLATPLVGSPSTFRRGLAGQRQVRQQTGRFTPLIGAPQSLNNPRYNLDGAQRFLQEFGGNVTSGAQRTAASLRPGPTSVQFPFDDSLALLQGKAQYLQRQAQSGINTSQGILRNLQSIGPTALNPLVTRTPTTLLGKAGKLINPLSPINAGGIAAGFVVDNFLPESIRNTANVGLLTPGPIPIKALAAGLYDTFLNERNAGVGLATGTLRDNDPERYGGLQALENIKKQDAQRPVGTLATLGNKEVTWKGPGLRWQRTYSEGGGASPPPPAPVLPAPAGSPPGAQAGQLTSTVSDVPANGSFVGGPTFRGTGLSTGAGVPALRQNVQERALSQEVLNSAQQYAAPAGISLPSFYAGQQQLGRRMEQTGELQRQLTELSGATGMPPEALMEWANKNPGLAYRELKRLQGRTQ
jgi:hypothetical protein